MADSNSRRWWLRGISLLGILLLLYMAFSFWDTSGAIRELEERASGASRIVDRVYKYKAQHGVWPDTLSEVAEAHLIAENIWFYRRDPSRRNWAYLESYGQMHTKVQYWFPSKAEPDVQAGWYYHIEGSLVRFDPAPN